MLEPVIILFGLIIIMFFYVIPHKPTGPLVKSGGYSENSSGYSTWSNSDTYNSGYPRPQTDSLYTNSIDLDIGNASYETDPTEEYITLYNTGDLPVTISGWHLTNGKDKRPFIQNSKTVVAVPDNVTIPLGTTFLSATGLNALSPIVLRGGESAIITSGSVGSRSNIPIVSFKINKCIGYLEKSAEYTFTPSLPSNCISPKNEPGIEYLDTKCQDFIEGMGSCHVPKFGGKDFEGNRCDDCVDGARGLSRSCTAFLRAHYSYAGCLANHGNDADFLGKQWRVFLGNKWELWAERRETISLFDSIGKLIDYQSY